MAIAFAMRTPLSLAAGLFAIGLIVSLFSTALPADEQEFVLRARVLEVIDGDAIKCQLDSGPISVRLHGIDAPETNTKPKQVHGPQSAEALRRLVDGKEVDLEPVGQESYGRMVAIVYIGNINVNEAQLKNGEAWVSRKYIRKTKESHWCALENAARSLRRGLWSEPTANWIEPTEWRNRKKRKKPFTNYAKETTANCLASLGKR